MKGKIISILLIVIAMGLAIYSWFMLPAVVAVQVGFDGQVTNTMPKLLAIAIPLGVSVVGSVMNLNMKEEKNLKGIVLAVIGIGGMVLNLVFN